MFSAGSQDESDESVDDGAEERYLYSIGAASLYRNKTLCLAITYTYMYMCCTVFQYSQLVLYIALGRVMRMVIRQCCVLHK